jgi:hypothetical protein
MICATDADFFFFDFSLTKKIIPRLRRNKRDDIFTSFIFLNTSTYINYSTMLREEAAVLYVLLPLLLFVPWTMKYTSDYPQTASRDYWESRRS